VGPRDPTLADDSRSRVGSAAAAASPSAGSAVAPRKAGTGPLQLRSVHVVQGVEREGIVFYVLTMLSEDDEKWSCQKRFSQFEALHGVLFSAYGHKGFPAGAELPPKKLKLFVAHTSEHFIEERRCLLDHYLKRMAGVADVAQSEVWADFLRSDLLPKPVDPPVDNFSPRDDAEVTGVSIPQTRMMSDHVLYQVDVMNVRKRRTFQKWTVLKRFSQFSELNDVLRAEFANDESVLSSLPASPSRASKLIYNHLDLHFVEQRRVLLENWMRKLMRIDAVSRSHNLLSFLGVQV